MTFLFRARNEQLPCINCKFARHLPGVEDQRKLAIHPAGHGQVIAVGLYHCSGETLKTTEEMFNRQGAGSFGSRHCHWVLRKYEFSRMTPLGFKISAAWLTCSKTSGFTMAAVRRTGTVDVCVDMVERIGYRRTCRNNIEDQGSSAEFSEMRTKPPWTRWRTTTEASPSNWVEWWIR